MACLSDKGLKGLLVGACQHVGTTLSAAKVRFLQLEEVHTCLRLVLGLNELLDDGHPWGPSVLRRLAFSVVSCCGLFNMTWSWSFCSGVRLTPSVLIKPATASGTGSVIVTSGCKDAGGAPAFTMDM